MPRFTHSKTIFTEGPFAVSQRQFHFMAAKTEKQLN